MDHQNEGPKEKALRVRNDREEPRAVGENVGFAGQTAGRPGVGFPVRFGQAAVFARDLISHSSTASRSSTSSQPQIMARVWAERLWPVVIM